ncbi:hypothetical protein ACT3UA_03085 [Glutamicibacter sp. 363]|uniref:hypothetical protein n=1 Tax=Micrococcaceae TaxID=1268 RepID=UPI0011413901|nr:MULTISPECIES: hypothetical protein [Micrococcaceae]
MATDHCDHPRVRLLVVKRTGYRSEEVLFLAKNRATDGFSTFSPPTPIAAFQLQAFVLQEHNAIISVQLPHFELDHIYDLWLHRADLRLFLQPIRARKSG